MLSNAYFLAKIGADTAENEQHFAEILPKIGSALDGRRGGGGAPHRGRPPAAALRLVRPDGETISICMKGAYFGRYVRKFEAFFAKLRKVCPQMCQVFSKKCICNVPLIEISEIVKDSVKTYDKH